MFTSNLVNAGSVSIGSTTTNANNTICATTTTGRTIADYIRESIAAIDMAKSNDTTKVVEIRNPDKYNAAQVICIPPIKDYAIYNNRVIKVDFADGTSTKCVCDDEFDFYTGLAFCLFKRMLGDDGHKLFNRMMRAAMKTCDRIDILHEQEAEEEKRIKAKRRKAELKRAAKAAKKRQEQVAIQADGMLEAMRRFKAEEGRNL